MTKEVMSFRLAPDIIQGIRRLSFETGAKQYQLIEASIKDLIQRHADGKLKVIKNTDNFTVNVS